MNALGVSCSLFHSFAKVHPYMSVFGTVLFYYLCFFGEGHEINCMEGYVIFVPWVL